MAGAGRPMTQGQEVLAEAAVVLVFRGIEHLQRPAAGVDPRGPEPHVPTLSAEAY